MISVKEENTNCDALLPMICIQLIWSPTMEFNVNSATEAISNFLSCVPRSISTFQFRMLSMTRSMSSRLEDDSAWLTLSTPEFPNHARHALSFVVFSSYSILTLQSSTNALLNFIQFIPRLRGSLFPVYFTV